MADQNEKWEMPTPIFRSSDGSLPKTLQSTISGYNMPRIKPQVLEEDDDILSVLDPPRGAEREHRESSTATSPTAAESQPVDIPPPGAGPSQTGEFEASNPVKVTAATPKPKRSGFLSFLVIFVLIVMLAAAIVAGVVYILPRYMQGGNGPF